jgi:hypothetical protein
MAKKSGANGKKPKAALPPGTKLKHLYHSASGRTFLDCSYLGQRFDERYGFSPYESESWVLRHAPEELPDGYLRFLDFEVQGWFTMLWRSLKDRVYVAEASGGVYVCVDLARQDWRSYDLPFVVSGVWGLDDGLVFAWGVDGHSPRMFRWDGAVWSEMDCPGDVMRMHGLAPDMICAVGADGLVARWDGAAWRRAELPTDETLTGVRVTGPKECWVCGQGQALYQGTPRGWRRRATAAMPLHDVAVFAGRVFVAGGPLGLLRLAPDGKRLEVAKDNVKALSFDARDELVITCSDEIVGTADGENYESMGEGLLEEMTAHRTPMWLE